MATMKLFDVKACEAIFRKHLESNLPWRVADCIQSFVRAANEPLQKMDASITELVLRYGVPTCHGTIRLKEGETYKTAINEIAAILESKIDVPFIPMGLADMGTNTTITPNDLKTLIDAGVITV